MKEFAPKSLVLKTDGTNCDAESFYALKLAGAKPFIAHINDVKKDKQLLRASDALVIPGGFSYGDDVKSGKIEAIELLAYLEDELKEFVEKGKPILGICNGFQVLVRTGILPFERLGEMDATLVHNDSGKFECRWINLKIEKGNKSGILEDISTEVNYQVAHGEGKFFADSKTIADMKAKGLVVFRYVDENGLPTQTYPENPNGSLNGIAGITNERGNVLGMMPHPERYVEKTQHPNWRRFSNKKPQGNIVFEGMVKLAKNC